MSSLTIRRLDPKVKERLRVRAALNGHSMEEEARRIIASATTGDPSPPRNLADIARSLFGAGNGVELELPQRNPGREPPDFSER